MFDISDLRPTIVPKSDQLNAEQLLSGPITVRVSDVRIGTDDQPLVVHYDGDAGRPFKPCKTMRKVLIFAWGIDGREWVGRSMTLYNDPQVKFGGAEVGGIRISHMSDISGPIKVSLTATKGKKALHTVAPLVVEPQGPTLADVLAAIEQATDAQSMQAAAAMAGSLTGADKATARKAYAERKATLEVKQ